MVNVVTKSGSNKFHGTGFYSLRDSSFDARDPELTVKPSEQQHQFGFTVGGPLRRNRAFFFAGFDQHIFHEPTVVRFVNGEAFVRPQTAAGPATPGDYEADDQALVFASAAQLPQQSGFYPSKLLGNAGFAKLGCEPLRTEPARPSRQHVAIFGCEQRIPRSLKPGHNCAASPTMASSTSQPKPPPHRSPALFPGG